MQHISTRWKIVIASICVASAAVLTGCEPRPVADGEGAVPETETNDNAGQPGKIDIDVPGAEIDIETNEKPDSVEVDIPDGQKPDDADVDVTPPEQNERD